MPALTVTLARAGFAAVLLPWFVIGGLTKIGGLTLSVGPPAGVWPLSLGAYYAYLPEVISGNAAPSFVQHAFVLSMTIAELILPLMVVGGLLARLSAALLIAQIWIASLSSGQLLGAGRLFDASPFDPGPDQLVLWSLVLLPVAIHGAGPVSIDGLLARWSRRRIPPF
jgi:putative oxidoreductase